MNRAPEHTAPPGGPAELGVVRIETFGWRWAAVTCSQTHPNRKGSGEIFRDALLSRALLHHGFIQFASAGQADYDPVCFSIAARIQDGDMQEVRLDQEEVLGHERIEAPTVPSSRSRESVQRAIGAK